MLTHSLIEILTQFEDSSSNVSKKKILTSFVNQTTFDEIEVLLKIIYKYPRTLILTHQKLKSKILTQLNYPDWLIEFVKKDAGTQTQNLILAIPQKSKRETISLFNLNLFFENSDADQLNFNFLTLLQKGNQKERIFLSEIALNHWITPFNSFDILKIIAAKYQINEKLLSKHYVFKNQGKYRESNRSSVFHQYQFCQSIIENVNTLNKVNPSYCFLSSDVLFLTKENNQILFYSTQNGILPLDFEISNEVDIDFILEGWLIKKGDVEEDISINNHYFKNDSLDKKKYSFIFFKSHSNQSTKEIDINLFNEHTKDIQLIDNSLFITSYNLEANNSHLLNAIYQINNNEFWIQNIHKHKLTTCILYVDYTNGIYFDLTLGLTSNDNIISIQKITTILDTESRMLLQLYIEKYTLQKFGPVISVKPDLLVNIEFKAVKNSVKSKSGYILYGCEVILPITKKGQISSTKVLDKIIHD